MPEASRENPAISVCVLTCDRDRLLVRLLEALRSQLAPGDEVVILDTGGSAETQAAVEGLQMAAVRYVAHPMAQFDFAAARNELLRLAANPLVVFTDDDATPLPGWLQEVRNGLQNCEATGGATLAQGPLPEWWNPAINWCVGLSPPGTVLGAPGFYPDTCNMAARREVWQEFPFQQVKREGRELYATGREDADWWMQRRLNGRRVAVNYRQAVSHYVHPDRLSRVYVLQRAYNDGVAAWIRQPDLKAATDIPWDLAHAAGVVFDKTLKQPWNRRDRLPDVVWLRRQYGKFCAVWQSDVSQRPRHREQLRQLAKAGIFQMKLRMGRVFFLAKKVVRRNPPFPADVPDRIFISADCFVGDSLLLRPHIQAVAETFPEVDILVSARYPLLLTGLPENVRVLEQTVASKEVRSRRFRPDCAIVPYFPSGDWKLWRKHLAPVGATFDCDVGFPGRRDYLLACKQVSKAMEVHEHENLARLFRLWPLRQAAVSPPPAVDLEEQARVERLLAEAGIGGDYITVALGSGHPSKSWPIDKWKRLLELILPEMRLPVVFAGTAEWRSPADEIATGLRSAGFPVLNLCAESLEALLALLSRSALVLGGCSGPKHIAMAYGVPTFTLYSASEPIRWGAAWDHELHGYLTALPQKLSHMELQNLPEEHRINLLQPDAVAGAVMTHWRGLLNARLETNPSTESLESEETE